MGRKPLYYTFGNHMHWVDMQWLWGYDVLPGSVRDMLRLIDETGARGSVNFDGIGYEKMAAECPEALAQLRDAVRAGMVEPVGCSYGQPYGLFHGGESNIRQLTYGVRTVRRLLGVRARAFWEEEFYFFPQLPQMLAQCGYTGACLFFQWTWHTPEVPREPCSLILWEGVDGTRIPTLPRNELNVHQWPEEFEGLLESGLIRELDRPAIVQWLELMPSKDWMCRSELLLPRLKDLVGDPRFEVRARTVSQIIEELREADRGGARAGTAGMPGPAVGAPVRRYSMDDAWHGVTLGKNADRHPRMSQRCESAIGAAESLSALAGVFGRPYPSWDAYPVWELDEAWRDALAAQHHDNHECEGLCGFVGHRQFRGALEGAAEVAGRAAWLLGNRSGAKLLETNSLGWERTISRDLDPLGFEDAVIVPPFGFATRHPLRRGTAREKVRVTSRSGRLAIAARGIRFEIDRETGAITQVGLDDGGPGVLGPKARLFAPVVRGSRARGRPRLDINRDEGRVHVEHDLRGLGTLGIIFSAARGQPGVDVDVHYGGIDGHALRPGFDGALQCGLNPGFAPRIHASSPFCIDEITPTASVKRKYPSGDWMTAPQWFETVTAPFTSSGLVDLVHGSDGLLICHEACQQWFADKAGARVVITARDPWDEGRYDTGSFYSKQFRLVPHGSITNTVRARLACEAAAEWAWLGSCDYGARPVGGGTASGVKRDIPAWFGGVDVCNAPNVLAHAFFRESMKSGEDLPEWAGHRMFRESSGACTHPYVIRLVEWDGEPAEVVLKLPGPVAMAAKTSLMGEVCGEGTDGQRGKGTEGWKADDTGWLKVEHPAEPPEWARRAALRGQPIAWSQVRVKMRPREIATVMADLVMGRKEYRDLDAKRAVWARVHRENSKAAEQQSSR